MKIETLFIFKRDFLSNTTVERISLFSLKLLLFDKCLFKVEDKSELDEYFNYISIQHKSTDHLRL